MVRISGVQSRLEASRLELNGLHRHCNMLLLLLNKFIITYKVNASKAPGGLAGTDMTSAVCKLNRLFALMQASRGQLLSHQQLQSLHIARPA